MALEIILWGQSASLQIETSKLHGNIHFGFDSRNHLTFIVQSLHVFFPSMVCVVPEIRPCGYYALWIMKLLTAAKASLSRMYVFFSVLLNTPKGVDHCFGQGVAAFHFVSPRVSFPMNSFLGKMKDVGGHNCWCPPTLSVHLYISFWYMF